MIAVENAESGGYRMSQKHAVKSLLCPGPQAVGKAVEAALNDGVSVRDVIVTFCGSASPTVQAPGASGAIPIFLVIWEAPQAPQGLTP